MDMTEKVSTEIETVDKNAFEGMARTSRTLRNVKNLLIRTLKEQFGIEDEDKVEALLRTHGLSISQFDFVSAMENAINAHILNDNSVDANANKSEKTSESIFVEATNPVRKAAGYDMLYRQMKQDYGKEEAKRLTAEMYTYALAIADSTKILSCYCYAINASRLVKEGRPFGQLHSGPTKHLSAYISSLCETIHQLSNHLAGAIAISTMFMDIAHILMYRENGGNGYTLDEIKTDKTVRKMIENEYQQFIHSVNHLSRNAAESPFSNISIFDRAKLKVILADEELEGYFDKDPRLIDIKHRDMTKEEYVIDYIYELQKIFIEFFDKGDPLSNGMPIRFPVLTLNLSKDDNDELMDEEFFDYITSKDIYRYNIFASSGTKVASCCFRGDTMVCINGKMDTFENHFKENGDKLVNVQDKKDDFAKAKVISIPYSRDWIELSILYYDDNDNELILKIVSTDNHLYPVQNKRKDIHAKDIKVGDFIKRYDVETGGYKYCEVIGKQSLTNVEGTAYCVQMENKEDPYFLVGPEIVTHNCRLINDLDLMKEFASQSNSFGGVGISLGSHRVVTINFNRIALESKSYDEYFNILDKRIDDAAKILASHKRLLKLLTDKGLQQFISMGWIRMDRLFSTFGILGLVEAKNTIKQSGWEDESRDIIGESLKYLNDRMFEVCEKYGIMGNIEQIPAESMAVRLAKTDRLLFGDKRAPYKLYANQFIPLWEEASIWEKLEADGKYNKLITGGGIVHAQIGEKVTQNQAKKIIRHSVKCGCEHFALNAVYTKCSNGHTTFGNKSTCPICGSQDLRHFTRVVGFFTEVENWNPVRRDWEFPNRTFVKLPKDDPIDDENETTKSKVAKLEKEIDEEYERVKKANAEKKAKSRIESVKVIDESADTECESCKIDYDGDSESENTSSNKVALHKDSDKPMYYLFHKTNCPHCDEIADKIMSELYDKIPGKTILCDKGMEDNLKLAKKYNIKETPSLVMFNGDSKELILTMNTPITILDGMDIMLTMCGGNK